MNTQASPIDKVLHDPSHSALDVPAWLQSILFVMGWMLVWGLGLLLEYTEHASVWFPAAGMTFAGLLVVGSRVIPLLLLCAVLSTAWANSLYQLGFSFFEVLKAGLVFGFCHITPYYLGARLLRFLANKDTLHLYHLIISFLMIAVASALVATLLVMQGMVATGMMASGSISNTWLPFWVGDMAGVVVMAPLFASIITSLFAKPRFWISGIYGYANVNASDRFTYKLSLSSSLLVASMLVTALVDSQESAFSIFFLLIAQMWITYTESALRTVLSMAWFAFLIALGVNLLGLIEHVIIYQFAINIAAASALFGLSVPALIADNKQLRDMVLVDGLTKAASREYLVSQSNRDIQRCLRNQQPLVLVVVDLDHFKQINDQFGHVAGDRSLIAVCDAVQAILRSSDLLGRYGGDEFVLLLPETDFHQAMAKAEEIRCAVQQCSPVEGLQLSCSMGLAEASDGDDFFSLFERADHALYLSKERGRNRISGN